MVRGDGEGTWRGWMVRMSVDRMCVERVYWNGGLGGWTDRVDGEDEC